MSSVLSRGIPGHLLAPKLATELRWHCFGFRIHGLALEVATRSSRVFEIQSLGRPSPEGGLGCIGLGFRGSKLNLHPTCHLLPR